MTMADLIRPRLDLQLRSGHRPSSVWVHVARDVERLLGKRRRISRRMRCEQHGAICESVIGIRLEGSEPVHWV